MAASFLDETGLSQLAGYDMRVCDAGTVIHDDDTGTDLELTDERAIVQGRTLWLTPRLAEQLKEASQ